MKKFLPLLALILVTSCSTTSDTEEAKEADTAKADVITTDVPKTDVPKTDVPKTDVPKTDNVKKVYSGIMDEYFDVIKSDSDYEALKKFGDKGSTQIRTTAEAFCKAKKEGMNEFKIKEYMDSRAKEDSKSFGTNSNAAERLLIKINSYSIELGKKYYCEE